MLRAVAKGLITTVVFFLFAEIALRGAYFVRNAMITYVPLPYALGDEYGPIPPWLDALLILKNDSTLIWRNEPNVHRTYLDVFSPVRTAADRTALLRRFTPTIPDEFRHNPTWEIRLNSEGFRGDEMPTPHLPSTVRIACLGDSWTFGMPVGQEQTYPSRLAAWLHEQRPDTAYDVQNFGVLGYSSFQGLQLLKTRVLAARPDVLVIGFGMNDSEVPGYRDKDIIASGGQKPKSVETRIKAAFRTFVDQLESYKLLQYEALALRFRPKPVGDYLKPAAAVRGTGTVDYDSIEPWTRVSPQDYQNNVREMIRLATEAGARVVLVDNELWQGSPYRASIQQIAHDTGAAFVDSLSIVDQARAQIEHDLETRLNLTARPDHFDPPSAGMTTVVFRAFQGAVAVPKALSIVGADAQLGALAPNTVMMHDDGRNGDQRAGDGVWSFAATFEEAKSISYVYTNSGATGQWEGLDVPHIRRVVIPAAPDRLPVYLPIETFGRVYMQGDDWHTDAVGYDAIGQAVAQAITALP
jgi:lysophospholipase L1-like esterase